MAKKVPYNQVAVIRGALRRAFARSPVVREVLMKVRREVPRIKKDGTRAKRDAVQYKCGVCGEYVGSTHVSVDHIDPVIPESGFTDWNTFILRLFCPAANLQPICDKCHRQKTNAERAARQRPIDERTYEELCRKKPISPKELKLLKRLHKKLNK